MLYSRRFSVAIYGLEVNDSEASLAEAITVLGVVASGFFCATAVLNAIYGIMGNV